MVDIKIRKSMFGNYSNNGHISFNNLNKVFDWLINGDHRGFWCSVVKNNNSYDYANDLGKIVATERTNVDRKDEVYFYVRTNNNYSDYMWNIERLDVDGICWFNHKDKDDYVVTNTFISQFLKPLKSELTKEIKYAD